MWKMKILQRKTQIIALSYFIYFERLFQIMVSAPTNCSFLSDQDIN